jgi:hypothetical protein
VGGWEQKKKNRSLSRASVEDASKKKKLVDFAVDAWLKRIGSKMTLASLASFIYRSEEVDKTANDAS